MEQSLAACNCLSLVRLSVQNMRWYELRRFLSVRMLTLCELIIADLHEPSVSAHTSWTTCLNLHPSLTRLEPLRCAHVPAALRWITTGLSADAPLREILLSPMPIVPVQPHSDPPAVFQTGLLACPKLVVTLELPRLAIRTDFAGDFSIFALRCREVLVAHSADRAQSESALQALRSEMEALRLLVPQRVRITTCAAVPTKQEERHRLEKQFGSALRRTRACCMA